MNRRVPIGRLLVLTAMWVALQGELTVGNVVAGMCVVAVVELLFPSAPRRVRVHPIAAARLALFVLWSLVVSSWHVMVAVVAPTPRRVRTSIVPVALSGASHLTAVLTANAITLTPGTLTVDITGDTDDDGGHLQGRLALRQRA